MSSPSAGLAEFLNSLKPGPLVASASVDVIVNPSELSSILMETLSLNVAVVAVS